MKNWKRTLKICALGALLVALLLCAAGCLIRPDSVNGGNTNANPTMLVFQQATPVPIGLSSSEPLHLSVKRLIDNGCTAVWVPGEDMRALEVNWLLQELSGKRVPEDISLLGSENPGISEFQRPSLSTISIPLHDMAEIAVDLVMEGECNILRKVEIPAKLIERNSVMSLK